MAKYKKTLLLGLVVLMLSAIAYAAPTINIVAGDILTGNRNINVSVDYGELAYCIVNASSAVTGAVLTNRNLTNSTEHPTSNIGFANLTLSSKVFIDANDWVIDGACYNITGIPDNLVAITGVIVDNTRPVIHSGVTTIGSTNRTTRTQRNIQINVTAANATSATLYIDNQVVGTAMTESSDVFYYTKDFLSGGGHSWYVVATDGRNSTTGTTYTFSISVGGAILDNNGEVVIPNAEPTNNNSNMVGIIVIALVIFWAVNQKKGKKR